MSPSPPSPPSQARCGGVDDASVCRPAGEEALRLFLSLPGVIRRPLRVLGETGAYMSALAGALGEFDYDPGFGQRRPQPPQLRRQLRRCPGEKPIATTGIVLLKLFEKVSRPALERLLS